MGVLFGGVALAVLWITGGVSLVPSADAPASPPAKDTTVVEATDELEFRPDSIRIHVGQAVRWRNVGLIQHSVTADPLEATKPESVRLPDGARPFNSGLLGHEETFTHTFDAPGRYRYFCIPHEGAGMTGTVIVTE